MNIVKWITGRAGKVALSAMQAVGLSAVVGVAGIAAWQYLDAPAETNNMFMPASYDSGEVVYVAGANAGAYAGGSYAGGGTSSSSMQISTNTLKRLERQELSQRAAQEMAEYAPDYSAAVAAPAPGAAYQMGGSDGLGTGANAVNEFDLKNHPLAAMQQGMAGVSNMVAQAQAQAQAQAAAGKPAGGTLASAPRNWGASGATGGSSGNAFNSSFSVQDSGKNTRSSAGAPAGAGQAGNVFASAQAQAAGMIPPEGARIRGRASFGSSGFGDSREASVQPGRRVNPLKNELEDITHKSAAAAKNRSRSVVEGARAFLASSKTSGGMMITADNVTTGQGQGSKDFEQDNAANLRGIKTWSTGLEADVNRRDKDRHDMQTWLWVAIGVSTVAAATIPFIKHITFLGIPIGLILALVLAAAATAFCAVGFSKAMTFAKTYGSTGYSTAAMAVTGAMVAGVWASFFLSGAHKLITKYATTILGLTIGGSLMGGFTAGQSSGGAGK